MSKEFKVGDKVQGKNSGTIYTITHCILGDPPRYVVEYPEKQREMVLYGNNFILAPKQILDSNGEEICVGDLVRGCQGSIGRVSEIVWSVNGAGVRKRCKVWVESLWGATRHTATRHTMKPYYFWAWAENWEVIEKGS